MTANPMPGIPPDLACPYCGGYVRGHQWIGGPLDRCSVVAVFDTQAVGLFPDPAEVARLAKAYGPRGERWRVDLVGVGGELGQPSKRVRVRLVDPESGRQLAAKELPFPWFADIAHRGTATVDLTRGQHT